MTLHWIIQDSPYREEGHYKLKSFLERMDIPHTEIKVVPFSHELIPEPDCGPHAIVMGSTTLARVAESRDWSPGVFTNDDFDYRSYMEHYGDYMMNNEAIICEFGNVKSPWDRFFFRPCSDSKSFAGTIMMAGDVDAWADSVKSIEQENYTTIDSKTPVVVAPLKEIYKEYRFFVVDGRVITGSMYKIGDKVVYKTELDESDKFAQVIANIWSPDEAFVLDIALTPDGFKVLEVNCFNSAGYYAIDIQKLVDAVMKKFG